MTDRLPDGLKQVKSEKTGCFGSEIRDFSRRISMRKWGTEAIAGAYDAHWGHFLGSFLYYFLVRDPGKRVECAGCVWQDY
jgi:hypothetical protein